MNLSRPLILASKSPRRSQLLKEAGFDFSIKTMDVDESFPADMEVHQVAEYIASNKAKAFQNFINDEIVITADTVVIVDYKILAKPADHNEAFDMIKSMSGRSHEVMTGVALVTKDDISTFSDTTTVIFKALTDEEINYYIENYKPFDKAGAYGIQEWIGMIGIERIEGSYFNVVGLPVQKVYQALLPYAV
ncbi:Maf family protein [Fulvivirga lutimaris]|uniref:Maf family protein n=1 Tax=Fulvivirga lutimaris TaxID=1819566 RepID=UPI0012BD38FA|nr:Maf family protein [Fulvivirga lutimaris]MTI39517.1 septum formation protein Maf [Fulvivirga lutimaris]